jgi:hypothetical protein
MKMGQSVPKRRHIKFRRRGITQKKAYNNTKFNLNPFFREEFLQKLRIDMTVVSFG